MKSESTGQPRTMLLVARHIRGAGPRLGWGRRALATVRPPQLFDYETITASLTVADAIEGVEAAFCALAAGKVDVPLPMHIAVDETVGAGPGDCHVKGGYVSGAPTWTVKVATVGFVKNVDRGLAPGGGVFVVMDAVTGTPCAIFQENRFMTDLRTGAAGGIALKHCAVSPDAPGATGRIAFLGAGALARNMARAAAAVRPGYAGAAWAPDGSHGRFAAEMSAELGLEVAPAASAEAACAGADAVFTCTPGGETVLELAWLAPHATVIAAGSDQPNKQELPTDVLKAAKYIPDLVKQTARIGELRAALADGSMVEGDVHAELGEVCAGLKPGRDGAELVVVDLTGTGAQDAAIGQVAWDKLGAK